MHLCYFLVSLKIAKQTLWRSESQVVCVRKKETDENVADSDKSKVYHDEKPSIDGICRWNLAF